ncbi:MAG: short-chain dehydrogenase [Candidatus Peregrinibacteria bacterium Greene0416_19]|nr:MAG: short-chain dehydrogenase [Candidatus Peregrinibacteria bacterium Greene0416_19]
MNRQIPQALVTGAGSGIGEAVTLRLIERGSHVYSFDIIPRRRRVEGLENHLVDVSDPQQIVDGLKLIRGKLNLVFSNAGVLARGRLFDVVPAAFERMVSVNMLGSWNLMKELMEQRKLEQNATVIQMCSTVGQHPADALGPYSLSKQMVHAYIQMLRREVSVNPRLQGLRILGLYLHAVKTPMTMAAFSTEQEYDAQALRHWGTVSTPADIADWTMRLIDSHKQDLAWDPERREYMLR